MKTGPRWTSEVKEEVLLFRLVESGQLRKCNKTLQYYVRQKRVSVILALFCIRLMMILFYLLPNTLRRRSVVRAAGFVRIFFSSWPTMVKSPSSALLVT